ncbi:glycosyltransferase [uncultured Thiodictyon sp.]|uniref:glycosyltransferase n=1 Tax=uncultured Thiodictyon sp. TaxID=1846217 RepID=UPI0025D9E57D|nr:glycosyltransferase [uncultured Thiodictyon sp.]
MPTIAFYLPDLTGGGAERTLLRLAVGFRVSGWTPRLVVDRARGELLDSARADAIPVDSLDASRTLRALPKLVGWLHEHRPAVLLSGITHNNLIAVWARALARVPTRIMLSERTVLSAHARMHGRWQYRVLPRLCALTYPHAAAVVAVSNSVADDLAAYAHLDRRTITVIPDPVVTPDLAQRAAVPCQHPWLNDARIPVIVAAGRLEPVKDFPTLLEAFALVRRQRPVRLLILGEGSKRRELLDLRDRLGVGADVELPGFQADPLPFFARAAVLAVSSRHEGFGLTVVEALACGVSVVSTNCGGPAEILANGRFGWLTPVGDAAALGAALADALDHPTASARLRSRSQDYTVAAMTQHYLNLFT